MDRQEPGVVNWLNGELKNKFEAARGKAWTLAYASMNEDALESAR
ncbi:hypothetical protein [Variovorax sp. PBL-E5]|nr:hypothetical protein [Variovorax sp. PBL-E5]VTU16563.1 hypothetical protein E5CHR_00164 [Variovorax sp. PBL-E5]